MKGRDIAIALGIFLLVIGTGMVILADMNDTAASTEKEARLENSTYGATILLGAMLVGFGLTFAALGCAAKAGVNLE